MIISNFEYVKEEMNYYYQERISRVVCSEEFQKWFSIAVKEEDESTVSEMIWINFPFRFVLDEGRDNAHRFYDFEELEPAINSFISVMNVCYPHFIFSYMFDSKEERTYTLVIEDSEEGLSSRKIAKHQY